MATTPVLRRAARARASSQRRTLTPAEMAWVAAAPCALVMVAAFALLGPALGRILFPPRAYDFWPSQAGLAVPEPTEHASYLLALAGALMLSAAVLGNVVRPLRLDRRTRRLLMHASQAILCAFLVTCLLAQRLYLYSVLYSSSTPIHRAYFTVPTVLVALLLAVLLPVLLRSRRLWPHIAACLRETPRRRVAALLIAGGFTAVWLLTAINVDSSVGNVNPAVLINVPWSMDETFAILDGATPLVTFHSQYGQLWPYVTSAVLALIGTGLGVYTAAMATIGGAALLSVFTIFRRVARSSTAALVLFLPFVSTGFFMARGPLGNRYGPSNLFTSFPLRYAGPYLLAWLLARHLDGRSPRQRWMLFLAAGLVAVNNLEFGVPAFGATLAACIWTRPPRTARVAAQLLGSVVAGLVGALALVCALTLIRSGSLPKLGLLLEFPKLYGLSGWAMLAMPKLGLHLIVYLTFVAALTVAAVRTASGGEDRVLTGLLAWSGVFGLGSGAYFVGRSHPEVLIDLFSAWTFALALLVVIVVRTISARTSRRPTAVEFAVLVGFGFAICSLAQTPTPWSQLSRLNHATRTPMYRDNAVEHFVARTTRRGEHVVILNPLGHRIAYDLGLVNVSPYASIDSMATQHQLDAAIRILRAAHGTKIFSPNYREMSGEVADALQRDSYVATRFDPSSGTIEFENRASP